jgi:type IV pilus assembly protein PilM
MIEYTVTMAFDLKKVFGSFATLQTKQILSPTKVVGIDFGSSSLKVVELEKREETIALSTYGELQLGPYLSEGMGASVKLPLQKKIEALVDAFREASVGAKDGVFAIPLVESFITVMSLSAGAEDDIAPRVNVEARKYIPVPMSDVVLEWSEVTKVQEGVAPLARDVLLVAIQTQSVTDNRMLLDAIAMTSRPSEIELFSAVRALLSPEDTTVAIIDLGAGMSKLYLVDRGVVQKIHRVPQGGAFATKTIATTIGIPYEDAENLKRTFEAGHPQAQMLQKSIEQGAERALFEFKRVIEQFETRTGTPVARVVLTGGGASNASLTQYVAYTLNRAVEVAQPFSKVQSPAFLTDTLTAIGPSFSVALGAALRQFE